MILNNINRITSYLKALTCLTELSLIGNQISDISFLKNFAYLQSLNLNENQVEEFHSIAEPTLQAIGEKNNKAIYKMTSQRFKEYNAISDFESLTKKVSE